MPNATAKAEQKKPTPIPAQHALQPLTGVQERLCDLLGDLITRGGTRRNLNLVLTAAVDHQWRRFWFTNKSQADTAAQDAEEWVKNHRPGWEDDLTVAIRTRSRIPHADRPKAKTVTTKIRENLREDLERNFEQFITEAAPEEISLLLEVLRFRDGSPWDHHSAREVPIAESFDEMLNGGAGRIYIRVPEAISKDVRDYANALLKALPKEAA